MVAHRPQQAEAAGVLRDVPVDVVAEPRPVLVDELLHADLVGLLGALEVALERLARAGLVGLEGRLGGLEVRRDVEPVAVLPVDPVVRVEPLEVVVVGGLPAEVGEEPLEDVGHEVPRGAHVEAEARALEHAGAAAELLVLLDDGDVGAGRGEVARRREPAEAAADDDDGLAGERLGVGVPGALVHFDPTPR